MKVSLLLSTPDEREMLLGREFRDINVLSMEFPSAGIVTKVVLEGRVVKLVGDPVSCLKTYLGGRPQGTPN